ncbi:NAD-dependent epimerase/dehydratase family protein [Veronia pacifica]|uniref:NAD-dependent epimerase/dehydratase domain-containing protein n=1 Tax=Veronia pacifica TaxID=1080227 RepID=A0A1C3EMR9_9GAMM|nr:NAD-dependent epimerase/dehydratase family protein [Veronia pacifica]ODA34530.1 hypothetical protein A8L45_06055 [Veronia pacifica]
MKILLLGATGTIGSAVLSELLQHDHAVLALARSDISEQALRQTGAEVIRGDIVSPSHWSTHLCHVDAVVHVAATFCQDMGAIDRKLIDELVAQGNKLGRKIRFIYTGGVWLYGHTENQVVSENSPFNPISSFCWMIENSALITRAQCFDANIIHPGIVYDRDSGALSGFVPDKGQIEVWGSLETRWPVVHVNDLASTYRLILEKGCDGESYNVCGEQGVKVGDIADAYRKRFDLTTQPVVRPVEDVIAEHGDWALGATLDQLMSADKIKRELNWRAHHNDILSYINEPNSPFATSPS